MPERVQLRRTRGYRKPEGAIVVTRPGPYGNPFPVDSPWTTWAAIGIGLHADKRGRTATAVRFHRAWITATPVVTDQADHQGGSLEFSDGTVLPFEDHVRGVALLAARLHDPPVLPERPDLGPLRGHDLACWCPLDGRPCHADVLLEVANR